MYIPSCYPKDYKHWGDEEVGSEQLKSIALKMLCALINSENPRQGSFSLLMI